MALEAGRCVGSDGRRQVGEGRERRERWDRRRLGHEWSQVGWRARKATGCGGMGYSVIKREHTCEID